MQDQEPRRFVLRRQVHERALDLSSTEFVITSIPDFFLWVTVMCSSDHDRGTVLLPASCTARQGGYKDE
jgi:hypothetical protein